MYISTALQSKQARKVTGAHDYGLGWAGLSICDKCHS